MWKYTSKLLLDIFLSVLATVTAAYVTHHYSPPGSPAKAPVAAAVAADPPTTGAGAAKGEPEPVASSEVASSVVNAVAPAIRLATRAFDANHDETAGLSPAKLAKPAIMPPRKRPAPREKSVLKTEMVATPRPAQAGVVPVVVTPEPGRAPERASPFLNAPQVDETRSERDGPVVPETRKPNLAGWVLKPIVRTVAVVAGAFGHERGPPGE